VSPPTRLTIRLPSRRSPASADRMSLPIPTHWKMSGRRMWQSVLIDVFSTNPTNPYHQLLDRGLIRETLRDCCAKHGASVVSGRANKVLWRSQQLLQQARAKVAGCLGRPRPTGPPSDGQQFCRGLFEHDRLFFNTPNLMRHILDGPRMRHP